MSKLFDLLRPNPFDALLRKMAKEDKSRFLIVWNRGLGDIPLGLYALVYRIRSYIPHASIAFLTRRDLAETFAMLDDVRVYIGSTWERGKEFDVAETLKEHSLSPNLFDVILEKPDPSRWLKWQLGTLTPELHWQEKWDELCEKYHLDPKARYVGAHVQTETNYASWRDWPLSSWQQLFEKCVADGKKVLLFGFSKHPPFNLDGVIDLRGETPLFELISIIKNHCEAIVVPDSGVSSMVYFLKEEFPLKHISLWADPNMGILKQNVASPNPKLEHIPLKGKDKDISTISPDEVYGHLQ